MFWFDFSGFGACDGGGAGIGRKIIFFEHVSVAPDRGCNTRRVRMFAGRGKNKNMGPMMAAMMMKMGMLKVLAFKVLALLVGKALLLSKLAFLLATVIGLKKLFSQQKHVTYEVVAHPHHESHHGSDSYSSAGWGRSSSEAAHSMAYSGQGT